MNETVHVSVWLLVIGAALIGGLLALAYKSHVTPKVEAETLIGDAETKVKAFDANLCAKLEQLEAAGKADAGTALKYIESFTGPLLKKL